LSATQAEYLCKMVTTRLKHNLRLLNKQAFQDCENLVVLSFVSGY